MAIFPLAPGQIIAQMWSNGNTYSSSSTDKTNFSSNLQL